MIYSVQYKHTQHKATLSDDDIDDAVYARAVIDGSVEDVDDDDGVRVASLLVAKLRFERLLNGSPDAAAEFDDDAEGFAATLWGLGQEGQQRGNVVAIDHFDMEAKGAEAVVEGVEGIGFLGARPLLQAVAVDDQGQVFKLAVACGHGGFPV